MSLQKLAEEYKNQAEILERKLIKLRKERNSIKGESLYAINKKINMLENMKFDCICQYNQLNNYYDK